MVLIPFIAILGFYSSGNRLGDSSAIRGQGIGGVGEVLPEYICGGAHEKNRSGYMRSRGRATTTRRRRSGEVIPSNRTGAQTAKRRNPGAKSRRVDRPIEGAGEGAKLGGEEVESMKGKRAHRSVPSLNRHD